MGVERAFVARRLLPLFGGVLLLGGIGHSVGVINLYATGGIPDANRVLLDVWVAQAQAIAGGLYLTSYLACRRRRSWRGLATFGALTIIGFSASVLPVLVSRAPFLFRIPVAVYLVASIMVLVGVATARADAN